MRKFPENAKLAKMVEEKFDYIARVSRRLAQLMDAAREKRMERRRNEDTKEKTLTK